MNLRAWKRILVGVAIGVGALIAGAWLLTRIFADREVCYQGKTLGSWLEQLQGQDAGASNRAAVVLDTQIIPQLTNQMFRDTNDSSLKMALMEKLNTLPGVSINFSTAPFRRAAAARALGVIGPPAKATVPALLRVLKGNDDTVRPNAAEALGRIHSDPEVVIPALITSLSDPRSDVRSAAAEGLGGWGRQSQAAVPRLIQLLDDRSDKDLMVAVREALKQIDPEATAKAGVK